MSDDDSASQLPDYSAEWRPLDLTAMTDRLATARDLLRQAAALTAAQEAQRVAAMADQQQRIREEQHGQLRRRRYR